MGEKSLYEKSEWSKTDFVQNYVDNAENFILERKRLISIMKSFYTRFIMKKDGKVAKVLDLGCGDGILSRNILSIDRNVSLTLLDGSEQMLKNAKALIGSGIEAKYEKLTFQEFIKLESMDKKYDFIVSSLAIHHITSKEKADLYGKIVRLLEKGGAFMNIDIVTEDEKLESWYLNLWEEWIEEREQLNHVEKSSKGISKVCKDNEDNLPDMLGEQLNMLKKAGFGKVDCFYKYGIFSIFGGFKDE